MPSVADLPSSLAAAHAMILAERAARIEAEAEAAYAKAKASGIEALIAHLKLQIEKLRRELYGTGSERTARLLDQLGLQLEDAEATLSEDASAAEKAAAKTTTIAICECPRLGGRKLFPEHLPRGRDVVPAPTACNCCGSDRLRKLGEDVTEALEMIPRRWKVVGPSPPAVLYHASRDRTAGHAERHLEGWTGFLQADAYAGYNSLYDPSCSPSPIAPALCWAHMRRQFFELADIAKNARRGKRAAAISPIALEAVKRIDALFVVERHQRPGRSRAT